jgi:tetratricopeptide (TPR) repeat protein
MRARGLRTASGEALAFGGAPYGAWHAVWQEVLDVPAGTPPAAASTRLGRLFERVAPDLAGRVPLLGAVLGVALPDNELTATLEPKLRKQSLEALLEQFLARVTSAERPLALLLEDGQWLDPLSRDLLAVLTRAAGELPLLLVAAYRPPEDGQLPVLVEDRAHVQVVRLHELAPDAVERIAADRLAGSATRGSAAPPALARLLLERAQGNPFYLEELLAFILASGVDLADEQALARLELPDGLYDLVLSRIDTLAEAPRRTVKVASVVGRTFRVAVLRGAYPELGDGGQVGAALEALRGRDLVVPEQPATAWSFRQTITRDVAYASMPFSLRERLHEQVGDHLAAEPGDPPLDLLASHYVLGASTPKKVDALRRAGEAAQAAYANAGAVAHYRLLAPLVDDAERGEVLLHLGQVLELTGAWVEAEQAYADALTLARQGGDRLAGARAHTALADVARKQGRYEQAADALELAFAAFVALDDRSGVGRVLHLGGTLAAQRGAYDEARDKYHASLEIRRELGDRASMAALLSNLAVVAEYDADYTAARELNEQALALRLETGDRWAIGVSQNNLGMISLLEHDHAEARDRFAEAMRLNLEVGDLWMVAIAHHNLGNALRGLGNLDGAREHLAEALRAYVRHDDRWALAILFEDLVPLAAAGDRHAQALLLEGAAEALREELGAPRSPSQEAQLQEALVPVRAALPDRADLVAAGRALPLADAVATAAVVCTTAGTDPLPGPEEVHT